MLDTEAEEKAKEEEKVEAKADLVVNAVCQPVFLVHPLLEVSCCFFVIRTLWFIHMTMPKDTTILLTVVYIYIYISTALSCICKEITGMLAKQNEDTRVIQEVKTIW